MAKREPEEQMAKAEITHLTAEPVIWSGWMAPNTMAEKPVRCMTESMLMPLVVEAAAQQAIATVIKAAMAKETVIAVTVAEVEMGSKARMETMPQRMAVVVEPVVVDQAEGAAGPLPALMEM